MHILTTLTVSVCVLSCMQIGGTAGASVQQAGDRQPECPPDVPTVQCFAWPCKVTACPAHPNATCVNNFCGGCNAYFFDANHVNVTASCQEKPAGAVATRRIRSPPVFEDIPCNTSAPQPMCLMIPCLGRTCPRFPDATCRNDFCNGACDARYFDVNNVDLTAQCRHGKRDVTAASTVPSDLDEMPCAPDQPIVMCTIIPCRVRKCARFPDATCRNDFCGKCEARFFSAGNEVTGSCQ